MKKGPVVRPGLSKVLYCSLAFRDAPETLKASAYCETFCVTVLVVVFLVTVMVVPAGVIVVMLVSVTAVLDAVGFAAAGLAAACLTIGLALCLRVLRCGLAKVLAVSTSVV